MLDLAKGNAMLGFKPTHILIEIALRRALEAAANARAMTMSAWIREAIKQKLEREENDEPPA